MMSWLPARQHLVPDLRAEGEHVDESQGTNAWDNVKPTTDIWLIPRVDPNAGKAPVELWENEVGADGYVVPFNS